MFALGSLSPAVVPLLSALIVGSVIAPSASFTLITLPACAAKVKVVSAVIFTIESGPAVTNPL